MKQIIIDFPDIFISVNQQYGSVRFSKTTMPRIRLTMRAKVYKEAVGWEARNVYKGKPIEGPVKVSIWYWFTSKRQDLGNDKLTMDSIENIREYWRKSINENNTTLQTLKSSINSGGIK